MAMLSDAFLRAITFAARLHSGQRRKGTEIPYLAHLLGVASLVLEYGGDEDQAIAALLHDTIEDCGNEHAKPITDRFGPTVLGLVRACSDDEVPAGTEKRPWRIRKKEYLAHLDELGAAHPALLVSAADKLHNARAIRADLRTHGLSVWGRFNRPAKDQLWYYRSLAATFERLLPGPLTDELRRTVRDIGRLDRMLRR
jgi:(p)ppGpp synthase/HD superfamily hydrolase